MDTIDNGETTIDNHNIGLGLGLVSLLTFVTDDIVDESVSLVIQLVCRHIIEDGGYVDRVDDVFYQSLFVCLLIHDELHQ